MLSKTTDPNDHSDWSLKLRSLEYALNNTVHSSTRFTPSTLLFGTDQRGPQVDELTEFLKEKTNPVQANLAIIRQKASDNILQSQIINEEQFSKKHRPAIQFQVGDFVVIRNVDNSTNGPYIIHKRLPNDRYVVRDIDGMQHTQIPYDGVLEADKLREWISPAADLVFDDSDS
uniref:Integrase catalytic domain-containing protein n=1 Tax=Anopheles stephensi TaxID=30069 RepID=A0A182YTB6_ANOST